MSVRHRVRVEIGPNNYESFIAGFNFYAVVVAPAMLFWLDLLVGETNLPDLRISDTYQVTSLAADKLGQRGRFDITYFNEELDKPVDYRIMFDFSGQPDFQPETVRQNVHTALQLRQGSHSTTDF